MYKRTPFRIAGVMVTLLLLVVVAAGAYAAGAASAGTAPWPYAVHGAFFLLGPFLFFFLFLPLFFGLGRFLFFGWGMGHHAHHGHHDHPAHPGHLGAQSEWADRRRAELDEWHRQAHGDTVAAPAQK